MCHCKRVRSEKPAVETPTPSQTEFRNFPSVRGHSDSELFVQRPLCGHQHPITGCQRLKHELVPVSHLWAKNSEYSVSLSPYVDFFHLFFLFLFICFLKPFNFSGVFSVEQTVEVSLAVLTLICLLTSSLSLSLLLLAPGQHIECHSYFVFVKGAGTALTSVKNRLSLWSKAARRRSVCALRLVVRSIRGHGNL